MIVSASCSAELFQYPSEPQFPKAAETFGLSSDSGNLSLVYTIDTTPDSIDL